MERALFLFLIIIILAAIAALGVWRDYFFLPLVLAIPDSSGSDSHIREGGAGPPAGRVKNLKQYPRSRSEATIIELFETITGHLFPTVTPAWLRSRRGTPLELDGYCPELGIAVEFSGPQHTKWYSTREDYATYFKRVSRDEYKKKCCRENGVTLIVIDMTISALHSGHRYHYVLSRLYDCGFVCERPVMYIDEQTIEPFRNPELESELGLVMGEIY